MAKIMKLFFYILFFTDVIIGVLLSSFINLTVGIVTACVLIFINAVTFSVILKIQKKKNEVDNNIDKKIIY